MYQKVQFFSSYVLHPTLNEMKCRISFIQQGFEAESTGYKGALKFAQNRGKNAKTEIACAM